MKFRPFIVLTALIGALVLGGAAWYLAAPLFRNEVVNEAFPFEAPDQAVLAAMSEEERQEVEEEFLAAVPDETTVAALTPEEQEQIAQAVDAAAAEVMDDKEMVEEMPTGEAEWVAIGSGEFVDADARHQGSGQVTIYQQGERRFVRFENFSVTNGPDLHVILSPNPAPAGQGDIGDYIDLGSLKGNQGNQNYEIPADIDLSQYQSIVIYCVPFHVVFSVATLN